MENLSEVGIVNQDRSNMGCRYTTKPVSPQSSSGTEIVSTHAALLRLADAGLLGDGYMVYEQEGETRVVFGRRAEIIAQNGEILLKKEGKVVDSQSCIDPVKQMEQMLKQVEIEGWTAYGYLAFDAVRYYHPYEKKPQQPDLHFFIPQSELSLTKNTLSLRSLKDTDRILDCISKKENFSSAPLQSSFSIEADDAGAYMAKVSLLTRAMKDERVVKTILSRALEREGDLDVFSTYRLATHLNNSARSYAFELGQVKGVGCSPEILLYSRGGGRIVTNPLAGTRKRGITSTEDEALRKELYQVPKEIKEHALSILLAQEELATVCEKNSVYVSDFMETKQYRCVQHLSSRVGGILQPGKSVYDALKILFPGITVSGISKRESVEWINRLESVPRGIYAGTVGWIESGGNLDLAIAIRSVYQYANCVVLNAGAGIIQESDPEFEYMETYNKMNTIGKTIILR
jgi:salicylate synthetase